MTDVLDKVVDNLQHNGRNVILGTRISIAEDVSRVFSNIWDGVECNFYVGDTPVRVAVYRYANDESLIITTFYDKGYRNHAIRKDAQAWEVYEAMAVAAFRRANPRHTEVSYALEAV